MIYRAGKYVFHEHYVAFHLNRENVFTPWRVIGIYASYNGKSSCRYVKEFAYFEDEYAKEVARAGKLSGTKEFLEQWRKLHVDMNSAITKVICYCTSNIRPMQVVADLYRTHVGSTLPFILAKIAVMVKSRERYFPAVFRYNYGSGEYDEVRRALKKAGLWNRYEDEPEPKVRAAIVSDLGNHGQQ